MGFYWWDDAVEAAVRWFQATGRKRRVSRTGEGLWGVEDVTA